MLTRVGMLWGVVCLLLAQPGVSDLHQWTSAGPEGGYVNRVLFDPSSVSRAYAGMSSNGVFKSPDSGSNWSAANAGLQGISQLVIANDGTLYALDTLFGDAHVYKSANEGGTWSSSESGLEAVDARSIAVTPGDSSTVFVGTDRNGLFKSADGGSTFSQTGTGLPNPLRRIEAITFNAAGSMIFLGMRVNGVYKSIDGGATWAPSNVGIETQSVKSIVIDPVTPANMYAGTSSSLFKSTDGGAQWSPAATPPGGFFGIIDIDPSNPSILYAGGGSPSKSVDGAGSWNPLNLNPVVYTLDFAVDPDNASQVLAATSVGMQKSSDGGTTWSLENNGLLNFYVNDILVAPDSSSTVYTNADTGVFKSIDAAASWDFANQGIEGIGFQRMDISQSNPSTLFGVTFDEVYRTIDDALSWQARIADPAPFGEISLISVTVDPTNPDIVYAGNRGSYFGFDPIAPSLLRSTNGGANWLPILTADTTGFDRYILWPRHIVIDPTNSNRIYSINRKTTSIFSTGTSTVDSTVLRTVDGGTSWEEVLAIPDRVGLTVLGIDPSNPLMIYAGASDSTYVLPWQMHKSSDGGDTWDLLDTSATEGCGAALVVNPSDDGRLYLGCTDLYVSSDGGATWSAFDDTGLPSMGRYPMRALSVVPPASLRSVSGEVQGGDEPILTTVHASTRWGLYSYTFESPFFADGFESGDITAWSGSVP